MDSAMRLRRGGVIMTMAAALVLAACQDGFFFDPAAGITPLTVQYTHVAGAEGPQAAGAADAFDKADGAQVVLRAADTELFNARVPLEASGTDKKISLAVELPPGSALSATLDIKLLQGTTELFSGNATATLTPGQAAEVTVPLAGVVGAVELNAESLRLGILGETFSLTTTGLFASGDTLGPVSATYRALGPQVSVTADGTVTALDNGTVGVEATYLGKADTVTILVDDRCVPGPMPAFGTTFSGVLDDLDCPVGTSDRVGDWFTFTLTEQTALLFALSSPDYVPRWWLWEEAGPGRGLEFDGFPRAHQLDDAPGFEAVVLPPGTYRLLLFSSPVVAMPRGGYSFTSQVITADNDFACPLEDGKGTLWLTPGYQGEQDFGGGCTGAFSLPVNQDRFAVYLEPGVEYVFRTSTPGGYSPQIRLFYPDMVAEADAGGPFNELRYLTPADRPGWHGFTVAAIPGEALGPYWVSFTEASVEPDPCAATPISLLGNHAGTLDYRTGCWFQGINASQYHTFTLTEETSFRVDLSAASPTNWGVVEASGPVNERRRFVTGLNGSPAVATLPAGTYALFVSASEGNLGPWSLTAEAVSRDLGVGCLTNVHVVPGFFGTQTLDGACVNPSGRNQDRYRVYLDGGTTYSVSVVSGSLITELSVFSQEGGVVAVGDVPGPASAPERVVGPGLSNVATFLAPVDGWYNIFVVGADPGASGTYGFDLSEGGPGGNGSLSGRVLVDGAPLGGVTVILSGPVSVSGVTDAGGNYAIGGLPLGVFNASLSGLPPGVDMPSAPPFVFDRPDQAFTHDFEGTLPTLGTLSGVVTGDGFPLADVTVTAVGPGGTLVSTTDASGAYVFPDVVQGLYNVSISGFMASAYDFGSRTQAASLAAGGIATVNFAGIPVGQPLFNVVVAVSSDPNGHEPFIQETTTTALHVEVFDGAMISVFSLAPGTKWVPVAGTADADASFTLTGNGIVAGFPNIDAIFTVTMTYDGTRITGFTGTLTLGPGDQLPADIDGNHNPAVYTVTGTLIP